MPRGPAFYPLETEASADDSAAVDVLGGAAPDRTAFDRARAKCNQKICVDCGAEIPNKGRTQRCKPCSAEHMYAENLRWKRERNGKHGQT